MNARRGPRPLALGVLVATVVALIAVAAAPSQGASRPSAFAPQAVVQTVTTACNNTFSPTKFPLDYQVTSTPSASPVAAGSEFTVTFDITVEASASFLNGVYAALGGPIEIPILANKVTIGPLSGATGAPVQAVMPGTFTIPAPAAVPVAAGVDIPIGSVTGTYTAADSGSASFTILGNAWAPTDALPAGVTEPGWTGVGGGSVLTATGQRTYMQASLIGGVVKPYLVCMGGNWTVTSAGPPAVYGPPLIAPTGFGSVPISSGADPTAPECPSLTASVIAGSSTTAVPSTACTDVNGDLVPSASSIAVVVSPAAGTATVNADGSITYLNTDESATEDTFTYTATDGAGLTSEPATVTVTIEPPPPPTCTSPVALTVTAGGSAAIDPVPCSGDGFTPSSTSVAIATSPTKGTATVGATGAITYVNTDTSVTTDTFTFTATNADGKTSAPATVNVTIEPPPPPTCTSPVALTVENGGSATIDPIPCEGEGFTPSGSSIAIVSAPAKGEAEVAADGSITYTNTDTSATTDSFTFTATNEAGVSSTVIVNVTVNAPAFITGRATYREVPCTVDLTGDVVPITFEVQGTVPSAATTGETLTITDQAWKVTVPGALLDQVGPFLAGATSFDSAITVSVNGTGTDPANVAKGPITVPVGPIGAVPNPDLTEEFAVDDMAFVATGGDATFQMGPTTMVVPLPGGLVVTLACAPSPLPEPWLTVAVTGEPLPPKPPAPTTPTTAPQVLGTTQAPTAAAAATATSTSGTLPYTGTDQKALLVQILLGLLLLQVGYLLWSVTRPPRPRRRVG